MRPKHLIDELKRKFRTKTNRDLYKLLGMSHMALINWQKKKRALTARQIANAIFKSREAAVAHTQLQTIQPIVEYFPLKPKESAQGVRYELFDTGKTAGPTYIALRK